MSSGDPVTRDRIIAAARELLEQNPGRAVAMGDVARQARVSRQALYLHFADRTTLLLAVARAADSGVRTDARQALVDSAATDREALRAAVALQAYIKPRLHGVVTALDLLRRSDGAAQTAWQERDVARLDRCRVVIQRVHDEGHLNDGWTVETATALMWTLTSQRVWEDLVQTSRWSARKYAKYLSQLLEAALMPPNTDGN